MYKSEIDALKAVAIIAVIVNHFDKSILPSGNLGVDIFFVISGFLIAKSLISKQYNSFKTLIFDFCEKRVKRLAPALLFCVIINSIATLLFIAPQSTLSTSSLRTGIASLFGVSNLYLIRQATDYFGASAELNAFTHTWSLGVEVQFYLLFPCLVWFSGLVGKNRTGTKKFFWTSIAMAIISLALYFHLSSLNPIKAFYWMPSRFWEFVLGSTAYFVFIRSDRDISKSIRKVAQTIATPTFICLLAVFFVPRTQWIPAFTTVAVGVLTAILLIGICHNSLIYRLLRFKPFIFIGTISYSLYLWHWSVLTISRWTIGMYLWLVPFQLAAMAILAICSYFWVEQPLRYSDWSILKIKNVQSVAVKHIFIGFILSSTILFFAIPLHSQGYFYTGVTAPLAQKGVESLQEPKNYKDYHWSPSQCALLSNHEVGKVITPENCTFGDFDAAKRRFLVIGNSFSAAEIEMLKVLPEQGYGSVTITSCWGASQVAEIENITPWNEANDYYWNTVVPSLVKRLKSGDILVMINDGANFSPKLFDEASKLKINSFQEGISRMSEELEDRGISIIYQHGNPFMRESNCTPDTAVPQWWHVVNEPPCNYYTREESLARRRTYDNLLLDLQNKHSNFFVLDLFDVYCPTDICKFYNNEGVFLYRDEYSHPSVEANLLAQPLLIEVVNKVIRGAV